MIGPFSENGIDSESEKSSGELSLLGFENPKNENKIGLCTCVTKVKGHFNSIIRTYPISNKNNKFSIMICIL
jgi:hypothetical protein